jgi:GMP synthase-like glutamine amidotransferase/tetratricopeptide (TPR) repeat protein
LEHLRADPVGVFGEVLAERGIGVDRVMFHEGDPLPDWRAYDLIVAMGAGVSVWQEDEYPWIATEKATVRDAVLAGTPYFGICFGVQLLADVFGGRSFQGPEPEIGVNQVFLTAAARHDPVFRGFPPDLEVCEWHSNHFSLPPGAVRLARSPRYENQAIRYGRVAYGMQCHLEPSLDDIRAWLADFPESAVTHERQHGPGSVQDLLDDYADFVPFLQQTARQVFGRWLENAVALGGLNAARGPQRGSGDRPASLNASPPDGRTLIGRHGELARIDAALNAARRGESAVLVLRGEAGVGKSTLLDVAAERARGLRVLRAGGSEGPDAVVPFAGLLSLLSPLGRTLEATRTGETVDRFTVYAGVFRLLVDEAARTPLLILVDDADLVDEPSSEALGFIARRLGIDGVTLILATQSDDYLSNVESLRPAGLGPLEARALLDARWGSDLAPAVADQIAAAAGGVPLALLEIAAGLTPEQRTGAAAVDGELPSSAEWEFLRRVARLPSAERQTLLVAALAGDHQAGAVEVACRVLGLPEHPLESAQVNGLLAAADGRVSFSHPLARVAVIYSALRSDRRAAHAALAGALDGAERTWHRARAATRADESIAAELDLLAKDAWDRCAFASAADGFERAARLTPDSATRSRRLLEAARAAHLAGHVNAALDHLGGALRENAPETVRRDAEHLRGRIIARSGSAALARDQLVSLANRCEARDPDQAAQMLADAVLPALRAGGPEEAVEIARRATRLAPAGGPHSEQSARIALGTALILAGEYQEGVAAVDAAADAGEHSDDLTQRAYLGAGLALAGRYAPAHRVLSEVIDQARAAGAVSVLPYALIRRADVELEIGAWTAAAAGLDEARRLAAETGQSSDHGLALGALAWLEAVRGDGPACNAHVNEAIELALRLGGGSRLDRVATALGLLELGRGRPGQAIPHLREACRLQDEQGWSDAARTPHRRPDLIEALVLSGHDGEAREALTVFQRDVTRTQRPSALATAARCQALVAAPSEMEHAFEEALRAATGFPGPFEHARTALLYGEALISAGSLEHAAGVLAPALDSLDRLGAEPWAARASTGLRAAGGELSPQRAKLSDRLSARELEVALAANDGSSSRDIADRLVLGPRTVQLQLASAAIKLGLASSMELAEHVRREP